MPRGYLDTDIVSAMVKDDYPNEAAALDRLLDLVESGKLELVASELTRREVADYHGPLRKGIERFTRQFDNVKFVEDHQVVGFHNEYGPHGGVSTPLVTDDPMSAKLREIGLDRTDAHHVMLAISNGCDFFITCDTKTILRFRQEIEAAFRIRLMKPSELIKVIR
jgi:hypothetical protein